MDPLTRLVLLFITRISISVSKVNWSISLGHAWYIKDLFYNYTRIYDHILASEELMWPWPFKKDIKGE